MFQHEKTSTGRGFSLARILLSCVFALALACSEDHVDVDEVGGDNGLDGEDETVDTSARQTDIDVETDTELPAVDDSDTMVDQPSDGDTDADTASDEDLLSSEKFSFVVITDTHVRLPGNPDDVKFSNAENLEKLELAVEKINEGAPDAAFVAVTGDLVGCLFSDDVEDYLTGQDNPAETFKEIMDNLLMPYYVVLGNHDYEIDFKLGEGINAEDPAVPEAIWKKVLGIPPYHSLVYHRTRFLFLNSARGPARTKTCLGSIRESYCTGSFDEGQIEWLEQQLFEPEPSFLFFHHPVRTDNMLKAIWSAAGSTFKVQKDDAFYDLAEDFKDDIQAIFVGHGHLWAHDTLHEEILVYETGSIADTMGNSNNIRIIEVDPSTQEFNVSRL